MNGEGKIVEFRSRNKRFEPPLPLSDFYTQIQHYLFAIIEVQEVLEKAYGLFVGGTDIWQDQCERIIDGVQIVIEPRDKFYHLLLNTNPLPADVSPFRYPLLIPLHRINEQMRHLIPLLIDFCAICRKASKQRTNHRQAIEELLAELTQSCDEVQQRTYVLFDHINQVHSRKRNLVKV